MCVCLSCSLSVPGGHPPTPSAMCGCKCPSSPPLCASSSVHLSLAYRLLHLLSPSPLFGFPFTSRFQLRWLQHGAFLVDSNEAFPNKILQFDGPSTLLVPLLLLNPLSFPYVLSPLWKWHSATLPLSFLFLPLHCVAGFLAWVALVVAL